MRLLICCALALVTSTAAAGEPRQHGDLTISDAPRTSTSEDTSVWTRHIKGSLRRGDRRTWIGPAVPAYVPAGFGKYELVRLEPVSGGHLAQYFEPFGTKTKPGCAVDNMWENCGWVFRFYDSAGVMTWELDAAARFKRKDHLAVHAFTLDGATLYYHERCQTYSSEAKGKCSRVVAVDVDSKPPRERWRSHALVSNTDLVVVGKWLITGYGFTDERDYLYALDKETGRIAQKLWVKKAAERIVRVGDDQLDVTIYGADSPTRYRLSPNGKRPRLKRL